MRAIVVAGLTGIAPRDEVEGMIAAQMLACHDASMDCFRYAVAANKTSGLFRDYLNQAGKLSRTFPMLLDALNRHRGKGQQKITVEHVHVHSGAQAVVGVVETPGGGVQSKSKGQTHAREIAGVPPKPASAGIGVFVGGAAAKGGRLHQPGHAAAQYYHASSAGWRRPARFVLRRASLAFEDYTEIEGRVLSGSATMAQPERKWGV